MPAAIPDRYSLEVRLGRDDDIEEWLATDTSLDRPVLVRSLGPESSPERREEFVRTVGDAAKGAHPHLARVFAVSRVDGGAYAVSEWTGGATVADRVSASRPIDLPDFLPNATGLAGALAAMHQTGAVHGGIDTSAISYSGAHAAKLGGFGRRGSGTAGADSDVRALAGALETALTGSPPGGPPPSERVDGVPRTLDRILRSAQSGGVTSAGLEESLRAAPTPREPTSATGPTSRRLLISAFTLIIVAVGLVAVGFFLSGGSSLVIPTPTTQAALTTTSSAPDVTTTVVAGEIGVSSPQAYDPFGEGGENDQLAENLTDGDLSTDWRTERYLDPLDLLKPGVGVTVSVVGSPSHLELVRMSEGTRFDIYWAAAEIPTDIGRWQRVAGANAAPGTTTVELPARDDGNWLIWLTELGPQDDGTYLTSIAELRFLP